MIEDINPFTQAKFEKIEIISLYTNNITDISVLSEVNFKI